MRVTQGFPIIGMMPALRARSAQPHHAAPALRARLLSCWAGITAQALIFVLLLAGGSSASGAFTPSLNDFNELSSKPFLLALPSFFSDLGLEPATVVRSSPQGGSSSGSASHWWRRLAATPATPATPTTNAIAATSAASASSATTSGRRLTRRPGARLLSASFPPPTAVLREPGSAPHHDAAAMKTTDREPALPEKVRREGAARAQASATASAGAANSPDGGKGNLPLTQRARAAGGKGAAVPAANAASNAAKADTPSGKIAFLFLCRSELPLQPLWERFLRSKGAEGRFSIYVHSSDRKHRLQFPKSSPFSGSQIEHPVKTRYGTISLVYASLRLLEAALEDPANQRFVLLSESAIPIRSFDFVYDYLFATNKSFISAHATHHEWRYPSVGLRLIGGRGRKVLSEIVSKFKQLVPPQDFRKGSQWWTLTRQHATMAVTDKTYIEAFESAPIPDESYFQTFLTKERGGEVETRTLTYIDWGNFRLWRPLFYGAAYVRPSLIRHMQEMQVPLREVVGKGCRPHEEDPPCSVEGKAAPCYLFARKFKKESLDSLMKLPIKALGY